MAVDKLGHLERTFDVTDPAATASLFDQVAKVLAVLRDEFGLPAFLSSGALLGAVRDGRLIGHDCDMDVSYLSRYSHPADVARESFRVERALHGCGLRHRRFSAGDLKVLVTDADGVVRGIDVRAGFTLDGLLYLLPNARTPLPPSAIVPLGEVELGGRRFPAPADPPALLETTYGPGWRVPDPSFKFRPPLSTRRRLDGWMRGLRTHRDHCGMPSTMVATGPPCRAHRRRLPAGSVSTIPHRNSSSTSGRATGATRCGSHVPAGKSWGSTTRSPRS